MNAPAALAGVGGALLVAATLVDAFEVMLLPRRVQRRLRFVRGYFRVTWRAWAAAARVWSALTRGTFLSLYGPLAMLGLFAVWTAALIAGFGGLQWAIAWDAPVLGGFGAHAPSLSNQLYFSGVTFFTLGYGDVTAHTPAGRALSVAEAGIGFGLLAVIIGYLPVLYQLFSRRETYVVRLDARAGSPPTAAELLARHAVSAQGLASLEMLLGEWEHWAAELLESHLAYPMLGYYRSQHDNESWLAALTTVLDACALLTLGLRDAPGSPVVAGAPGTAADALRGGDGGRVAALLPTFQARMTFATARLAIVEMARALHVGAADAPAVDGSAGGRRGARGLAAADLHEVDALPSAALRSGRGAAPDAAERLPSRALARLVERLAEVGLALDGPDGAPDAGPERATDAVARLAELRRTYEPFVEALSERLVLPLPRWVAYDDATDNWQQSVGGREAKRIFGAAEAADAADTVEAAGPGGILNRA